MSPRRVEVKRLLNQGTLVTTLSAQYLDFSSSLPHGSPRGSGPSHLAPSTTMTSENAYLSPPNNRMKWSSSEDETPTRTVQMPTDWVCSLGHTWRIRVVVQPWCGGMSLTRDRSKDISSQIRQDNAVDAPPHIRQLRWPWEGGSWGGIVPDVPQDRSSSPIILSRAPKPKSTL